MAEIELQHLVGRRVLSEQGGTVGHIEAIHAEQDGEELVVTEYHVGAYAALERLSASIMGAVLLDFLGLRSEKRGYRIPWDRLDLSELARPRLIGPMESLPRLKGEE